ncbi:hypothetical protein LZ30DRAFT_827740 [Colletotrichum cereale]|nr:hypothetical protein LZ30DRAFT_827740 [Colletotrichum cereale]
MSPSITRQILGQKVEIGDLYNAGKDVVNGDSNLFDSERPEDQIDEKKNIQKTFTTESSGSKCDMYIALGLSTETGASIAAGLSKPAGASLLPLSSSSPSCQIPQAAAVCTVQAKIETLDTNSEHLKDAVNLQILENTDNATHVVVGITWGAKLIVQLQSVRPSDRKDALTDLERLASEIGRCFNTKSPGEADDEQNYEVKAWSDFSLKAYKTTTYEGICKFAAKFPTALDKATAALSVQLMPIKNFLELVQGEHELSVEPASYKEVDQKLLAQILEISDKIAVEKKTCVDLVTSFKANTQYLPKDQLDRSAEDKAVDNFDDKFRYEIGEALAKAHSGKSSSKLINMLADYATEGRKDPSKLTSYLKPWATKISVLSEAKKAGISVSTLAALAADPKSATDGANGANGTSKSAFLTRDVYAFYMSATATLEKSFEKTKAKAYELLSKPKTRDGKAIVPEIVADEEELEKMCLIRYNPTSGPPSSSGDVSVPLENRLLVVMTCPHPACSKVGPTASTTCMCPTCKEQVTFGRIEGSHEHMYCNCGSYDVSSAEFRCNSKDTHGSAFVSITPAEGETAENAQEGQPSSSWSRTTSHRPWPASAIYLGANSVTVYNDGVIEHLKYLRENVKKEGHTGLLRKYDDQRALHEALIKKRNKQIRAN